jgi:ABC-type transport system substrate-binding protein
MAGALGLTAVFGTGATVSYYEEGLPMTMNPLFAGSMVDRRSHELVFDRLFFHDAITNELKSRVVDRTEVVSDGKGIKLILKEGIKWHSGKALTSKDVCFTVNAMLNRRTASPVAESYREVLASCKTQGSQVAIIEFRKVFHNPRERLGFHILPQDAFSSTAISSDTDFKDRPTGTGPYKGSRGRRGVVFDAFANAHHTPGIAQLQLQEGGDPIVQVRTLTNDGVQGIVAVPPNYRTEFSATDEVALKSYDLRSWWFIAVNTNKPYLKDKRVRSALNLLIDRTELREKAILVKPGDQNSPCEFISGPFVQSSPYYNRSVPTIERSDRAAAEQLLIDAGLTKVGGRWHYEGQPIGLKVGMLASLSNEAQDLLSLVGNQLGAGGFDRQENRISMDEWNRKVRTGQYRDYDLLIGKWSFGLVEDVNDIFHTRIGKEGKDNIFNYSDAGVDALLDEYAAARTNTAAQDAYHKLHETMADELPYLFLWKLDTKSAWRTEVRGNIIAPYYYFTEIDAWRYR